MKRKEIITSGVLIVLFSLTFVSTANAVTTWGFEVEKNYVYELEKLTILETPFHYEFRDEARMRVVFKDYNDTGYSYEIYNNTDKIADASTVFLPVEVDIETTVVMPLGLPIALPLAIGDIPDYLDYFGQIVDETNPMLLLGDFMANISEYLDLTYLDVYSVYNSEYLQLKLDLFAPTVNETVLTELVGGMEGSEIPFQLPTNITDLELNVTLAFDATTGLFDSLVIDLDSLSTDVYATVTDFDIDVKYALYKPSEPEPTTTVSYGWIIPIVVAILFSSSLFNRKRK